MARAHDKRVGRVLTRGVRRNSFGCCPRRLNSGDAVLAIVRLLFVTAATASTASHLYAFALLIELPIKEKDSLAWPPRNVSPTMQTTAISAASSAYSTIEA